MLGRVASELADRVVVTSDNPRSEDPDAIVDEIPVGAERADADIDRRRAIFQAIDSAAPGDMAVIAGKGYEQGQEFERGRKEPFDTAA